MNGSSNDFEIRVDSVAGVRVAKAAGASRAELCANLLEGGSTPSRGMMHAARKIAGIGLNVMIRPRGGDFFFDDDEFAIMVSDIETVKAAGLGVAPRMMVSADATRLAPDAGHGGLRAGSRTEGGAGSAWA